MWCVSRLCWNTRLSFLLYAFRFFVLTWHYFLPFSPCHLPFFLIQLPEILHQSQCFRVFPFMFGAFNSLVCLDFFRVHTCWKFIFTFTAMHMSNCDPTQYLALVKSIKSNLSTSTIVRQYFPYVAFVRVFRVCDLLSCNLLSYRTIEFLSSKGRLPVLQQLLIVASNSWYGVLIGGTYQFLERGLDRCSW